MGARQRIRARHSELVAAINAAIGRVDAEAPTDRQHRRPFEPVAERARLEVGFEDR